VSLDRGADALADAGEGRKVDVSLGTRDKIPYDASAMNNRNAERVVIPQIGLRSRFGLSGVALLACGALAVGCSQGAERAGEADEPDEGGAALEAEVAGEESQASDEPRGLEDPGNEAEVVALATEVLDCEWEAARGPGKDCEVAEEWLAQREPERVETFVNLLFDDDDRVRWLGAAVLGAGPTDPLEDVELAGRIFAAAAAERAEARQLDNHLAKLVGRTDANELGLSEELAAIVRDHSGEQLRAEVVRWMGTRRVRGDDVDILFGLAQNEADIKVRRRAMNSLASFTNIPRDRADEICGYFASTLDGDDINVAGHSAATLLDSISCEAHWDDVLDHIEARAAAGTLSHHGFVGGLQALRRQTSASEEQKQRLVPIAKAIVENPANTRSSDADLNNSPRADALSALIHNFDVDGSYAERFVDDDERAVAIPAKRLKDK
jgi:hypothetical protein